MNGRGSAEQKQIKTDGRDVIEEGEIGELGGDGKRDPRVEWCGKSANVVLTLAREWTGGRAV